MLECSILQLNWTRPRLHKSSEPFIERVESYNDKDKTDFPNATGAVVHSFVLRQMELRVSHSASLRSTNEHDGSRAVAIELGVDISPLTAVVISGSSFAFVFFLGPL